MILQKMQVNNLELEQYINNFFGFGNLESDIWFIGKEEAGDEKKESLIARLESWKKLGKPEVSDNYKFHMEYGNQLGAKGCFDHLFNGDSSILQSTWCGLIKLQFAIEKGIIPKENILKTFQSEQIGRNDSPNSILELLPLPAPNHNSHNYSKWTDIPYLVNKETYKKAIKNARIEKLKGLIFKNKPKFVIFYSTESDFISSWSQVAGVDFKKSKKIKIIGKENNRENRHRYLLLAKNDGITFCVTQHPTYTGTSDNELLESGKIISEY